MLETVDLTLKLEKDEYREKLLGYQLEMRELARWLYFQKRSMILVFEGWDAAGKGGSIRRLTEKVDPRGFEVVPIAAPAGEDKTHHYMWRFWLEIPNHGQMTIFHRSWYRRVLLGRGEGRLGELGWHRAVRDILDFERALTDDGYVLVKIFLHISQQEREERYRKMEEDLAESWRIRKRSWKHHQQYEHYHPLVEEILARTETPAGPWKIVEATDPRWARITVLETIVERLEEALKARNLLPPELANGEDEDDDDNGDEDS